MHKYSAAAMSVFLTVLGIITAVYAAILLFQHRRLSSKEPPVVWSFIPFIGSAVAFGKDSIQFIKQCQRKYGNVFTLIVVGKRMTFVLHQPTAMKLLNNTKELSFAPVMCDVQRKVFEVSPRDVDIYMEQIHEKFHKLSAECLLRRDSLDELTTKALDCLDIYLAEEEILGKSATVVERPLYALVKRTVNLMTTAVMFGKARATEENFEHFLAFDDGFPLLMGGLPQTKAKEARNAIEKNFFGPGYEKTEDMSKFITAREKVMSDLNESITPKFDAPKQQTGMVWAANSNTMPTVFWMLYYLMCYPEAQQAVLAELKQAKAMDNGKLSIKGTALDELPVLDAMLLEVFRVTSGSMGLRELIEPKTYSFDVPSSNGKPSSHCELRPGDRLVFFPPYFHHMEELFEHPQLFKWDRFLQENGKDLARKVIPFGGGITMCPGRNFARREIKAFVADALVRYEWSLVDDKDLKPPSFDQTRSGVGIFPPAHDIKVQIRKRP